MRDQQVNSFGGGMMKDLGTTIPQQGTYVDAKNIRVISDASGQENNSGVIKNVKGNKKSLDFSENNVFEFVEVFVPDAYSLWVSTDSLTLDDLEDGGDYLIWPSHTYLGITANNLFYVYYNNSVDIELFKQSLSDPIQYIEEYLMEYDETPNIYGWATFQESYLNLYETLLELIEFESVEIIGSCLIRNTAIIFCNLIYEAGVMSSVLKWDLNSVGASLIYSSSELNFNKDFPIEAVSRYEAENIQRVYWTDNLNPVRSLNIAQEDLFSVTVEETSLSIPATFSSPKIKEVNKSGTLPAGMYQYAYRLKTLEGNVTRFSPLSNFTHIVNGSQYWDYQEDPENQTEYSNTAPGEITDKAVVIEVSGVDLDYDFIEIAAIYKASDNSITNAYLIDTTRIDKEVIKITHSTDVGASLLIEEITEITNTPSKVKSIATKDNRLFLGGVQYSPFNLEFNSRAYRYKRSDGVKYPRLPLDSEEEATTYVDEEFNPITLEGNSEYTEQHNIDAVNPYNNSTKEEITAGNNYKFRKDGVTLGGEGPNIKYKFIKKRLEGNKGYFIPNEAPYVKSTFRSDSEAGDYKSPENVSEFIGYHRNEIYRFGIVLYDLQGNPGFVSWIGDIKFPDYQDYDINHSEGIYNFTLAQVGGTTDSGTNYIYNTGDTNPNAYQNIEVNDTSNLTEDDIIESNYNNDSGEFNQSAGGQIYALGIEFKVTIPTEIKNKISGYRVVRVERKQEDKTILGTGVVNFATEFWNYEDQNLYSGFSKGMSINQVPLGYGMQTGGEGAQNLGQYINRSITIDSPDFAFGQYPTSTSNYLKVIGVATGRREDNFEDTNSGSAACYSSHKLGLTESSLFSTYDIEYASKIEAGGNLTIPNFELEPDSAYLNDQQLGFFNNYYFNPPFGGESPPLLGKGEETLFIRLALDNGLEYKDFINDAVFDENIGVLGTGKILASVKSPRPNQYGGNTELKRKNNSYIAAGLFVSINNSELLNEYNYHSVWGGDIYTVIYDLEKMKKVSVSSALASAVSKSVNFAFPVESTFNTTLRGGWHFANKVDWSSNNETPLNSFDLSSCYSSENNTEVFIPKPLQFNEVSSYDTRVMYSDAKINNTLTDNWKKFRLENYKDLDGASGPITKLILHDDNIYFLQERGFGALSINPTSTVIDESGSAIVLGTGSVIQDFKYLSSNIGAQSREGVVSTSKGIYWVDQLTRKSYAFRANGLESLSDVNGMKSWFASNINNNTSIVLGVDSLNNEVLISTLDNTLAFNEVINKFTSFYTYGTTMYLNSFDRLFSAQYSNLYEHNVGNENTFYGTSNESSIEFVVNKNPIYTKVFDNIEWYTGSDTNKFQSAVFENSVNAVSIALTDAVVKERVTKLAVPRTEDGARFRDTYIKVKLQTAKSFVLHYVKTLFRISRR